MAGAGARVALLLLGLVVGAAVGWVSRPQAAELKLGGLSVEIDSTRSTAGGADGPITGGQARHIFIYALAGGVIGALAGFAVDRRSR